MASCAKQSSPTGGPRDEVPPKLIESEPTNQSINKNPKEITLTFDEFIALENASKNVIITPRIDKDKIEFTSLKNSVTVKLNQELEDSTTYVFDFQKSVVDLSEQNPVENLKVIFSTGSAIDSLTATGNVNMYNEQGKIDYKNILIGLYPISDTIDVFTAQPYYLGQVDTTGTFKITNIRNGDYRAYAWKDLNGNLKSEFKTEEYDFILDTIRLQEDLKNIQFNLSKADLTPIRILRSSVYGKNYDVIINRNPLKTSVKNDKIGKDYFYTVTEDKRLRLYSTTTKTDSIPFHLTIEDSVGFQKDSLIWAKFKESERKPDKLEVNVKSGINFYKQLNIQIKFNKPISEIKLDSLVMEADSTFQIPITNAMLSFLDSTKRDQLEISLSIPDTIKQELITLRASATTFIDIEKQTNEKEIKANFRKLKREDLADELKGKILEANPPFIIQLINSKEEIVREEYLTNGNEYSFKLIEPGSFKIRVIEDSNNNRNWDPSNYTFKKLAERIFYYKGEEDKNEVIVRSGWTLEEQNITATKPTGLPKPRVEN
jgi:hypothetical protein